MLTQEYLKSILHYDHDTGIFAWLKGRGRAIAGSKAGSIGTYGYIYIRIGKSRFKAHRLAWLYMTGKWPENEIDHKNRIRHDNKWKNLRDGGNGLNQKNRNNCRIIKRKIIRKYNGGYEGLILISQSDNIKELEEKCDKALILLKDFINGMAKTNSF